MGVWGMAPCCFRRMPDAGWFSDRKNLLKQYPVQLFSAVQDIVFCYLKTLRGSGDPVKFQAQAGGYWNSQ